MQPLLILKKVTLLKDYQIGELPHFVLTNTLVSLGLQRIVTFTIIVYNRSLSYKENKGVLCAVLWAISAKNPLFLLF